MTETIGERLQKARQERRLTLDQVFQTLHIRQRFLEALENNQRDLLPSDVQGRGFLRMYADFLGIPVQPLLQAWENNSVVLPPPEPLVEIPVPASETPPPAFQAVQSQPVKDPSKPEDLPESQEVSPTSGADQSDFIFREIGGRLRRQREILGLSLIDIEQHLHIRLHYLKALEAGLEDDLPSLAQGRGMLKNYAHFLEMDAEALLMRFADAQQARRIERVEPGNVARVKPHRPMTTARPPLLKRLLTPDLLVISLVIVVFFGFAIWSAAQVSAINSQHAKATPPSIAQVLLITPSETAFSETEPPEGAMNTPVEGEQNNTQVEASNAEPTAVPTLDNLPLQVYIVAVQRAWMRVTVDGKVAFDGRVLGGNAYPFSGKTTIEMITGNAAALQVYYNQRNFGTLGVVGQVSSLIFSKDGIVTPTASFAPTSTATPISTVTLKPSPTQSTPTVTPYIPSSQ
jgi:cytoskeleton protein RodZ